jgi:mannan endo-1,4-beta-mannosidase
VRAHAARALVVGLPVIAATVAAAALVHTPAAPTGPPPPPQVRAELRQPWYLGVREHGAPGSWAPVADFARATGTRPGIVLYYSGWRQPFPAGFARTAYRHGAVLLAQMEPWGANLRALARGSYLGYLRTFARQVRDFGHPVIIGFGHEMNGRWYPWGAGHVPAATFVAAWRRLVTIFRSVGAGNVTWLWTVHHTRNASVLHAYWPGSRYVTWVGLDGYYEFPGSTFGKIFGRAARAVRTFTGKPILISEAAVGPGAGDVPAKIRQLFAGARQQHFIGLVWFDIAQNAPPFHQDWRLEGKPAVLAAFQAAARRASQG